MAYVDYSYYVSIYGGSAIPETAFPRMAIKAENKINATTFNRIDISASYASSVKMCACEIAEALYTADQAKTNGMIMKSYSNDGESGTFDESSMTEAAVNERINGITTEWLWSTGLLYRGCL